jgi:hypothetical protein
MWSRRDGGACLLRFLAMTADYSTSAGAATATPAGMHIAAWARFAACPGCPEAGSPAFAFASPGYSAAVAIPADSTRSMRAAVRL